jgi:hypothetical protein
MKEFVEKIKPYTILVGWVITILGSLWMIFGVYDRLNDNLKIIQKSTLRNTIWNENIPMHDRLESCDSYLALGYNSETKKYCNKLLEK